MTARLTLAAAILATSVSGQRPALEARFIGNMSFAISDGTTTVMTDFPYQSGYSGYMTYDASAIRSTTAATLSLITHRHSDHWEPALFSKTSWQVAGPDDVLAGIDSSRIVAVRPSATFGAVRIEPIQTPHAGIGHYSYVLTWHGRRLYFSGDTESIEHLVKLKGLDVAFVSPWLFRSVRQAGAHLDAKQVVIYHHQTGENVPECPSACTLPRQGQGLTIR